MKKFKVGQKVKVCDKPFVYCNDGKKGYVNQQMSNENVIVESIFEDRLWSGTIVNTYAVLSSNNLSQVIAEECLDESE